MIHWRGFSIDKSTLFFYSLRSLCERGGSLESQFISPVIEKGDEVTKADIVNQIAEATGLTKTDTAVVVEGLLSSVIAAMQRGEHIEIRGFGTFKVVNRAPRTGRNPKTGDVVKIPSRPVPVFKPSRELRDSVENGLIISPISLTS